MARESFFESYGDMSKHMYVDLEGNPVKRNKQDDPYGYDPYVVWEDNYQKGRANVVYSDRLFQWDAEKYNKFSKEIWDNHGQYFTNREPEEIEKFLSLYLERDIKLTAIMEGCNVSNGYPYWIFYFEDK